MVMEGIDISTWQSRVPSNAGRFVICRGTYGEGVDSKVEQHVRNARARHLFVGLYAFGVRVFRGEESRARVQAETLLRLADRLDIQRVALDWESDGARPMMTEAQAREFIRIVKAERGECGLYASEWQFKDFGQTWDWVAKWGPTPPRWASWEVWQYQGTPIDRNKFNGDLADLEAFFNRTAQPVPKPDPRPIDPEPQGEDNMFNIGPSQTQRDAVLKAGTVLFRDSKLTRRVSRVEEETPLGFLGSGPTFHAVVNGGNVQFIKRADAKTTSVPNVRTYT